MTLLTRLDIAGHTNFKNESSINLSLASRCHLSGNTKRLKLENTESNIDAWTTKNITKNKYHDLVHTARYEWSHELLSIKNRKQSSNISIVPIPVIMYWNLK